MTNLLRTIPIAISHGLYGGVIVLLIITHFDTSAQKIDTVRVDEDIVATESKFIAAIQARLKGDFDESEEKLNALISTDERAPYHYELARLYRSTNAPERSIKALRRAIKLDDQNEWYWQLMADFAKEDDQPQLAIEAYEALLELHPHRVTYLENLALHHLEAGEVDKALSYLDRVEQHTGVTLSTSRRRHKIYDRQGRHDEAIQSMTDYIDGHPWDMEMKHAAAAYAEHHGMNKIARGLYDQILEIDPQDVAALQRMAALEGGEIASDDLDQLLAQSTLSLDDKIKLLLPKIQEMSMTSAPIDSIWRIRAERIEAQHGPSVKTKSLLGDIRYLSGDVAGAISSYEMAIELDPNHYHVWDQLLALLAASQQWDAIEARAEEAIEYFPNQPMPYAYLARSLSPSDESERLVAQARLIAGGGARALGNIDRILRLP